MIPEFNNKGTLPEGTFSASWPEIVAAFGGNERRRALLSGLRRMLHKLAEVGCHQAYLDGSFVTNREMPGDFDLSYDLDYMNLVELDPILRNFTPPRALQKLVFGGEAIPNIEFQRGSIFIDWFKNDKTNGGFKGIVAIDPRTVP